MKDYNNMPPFKKQPEESQDQYNTRKVRYYNMRRKVKMAITNIKEITEDDGTINKVRLAKSLILWHTKTSPDDLVELLPTIDAWVAFEKTANVPLEPAGE